MGSITVLTNLKKINFIANISVMVTHLPAVDPLTSSAYNSRDTTTLNKYIGQYSGLGSTENCPDMI